VGSTMSSQEQDDAPNGYRPVSGLAVAAFIAGLLSAAALVNPFFWVVPLLAIGLACLGLADVSRVGAEKAGRIAALAGLALAIGFGAQAVSSTAAKRWIASARARSAAEVWIEALHAGRVDDARAMCLPDAVPKLDAWAGQVAECGAAGQPVATVMGRGEENPDTWRVRATVEPCAAGPIELIVELAASTVARQEGPVERWMVVKAEPAAP
jgi:hypothetical protein